MNSIDLSLISVSKFFSFKLFTIAWNNLVWVFLAYFSPTSITYIVLSSLFPIIFIIKSKLCEVAFIFSLSSVTAISYKFDNNSNFL